MTPTKTTESLRLQHLAAHQETSGMIGDWGVGSSEFAKSETALFMCMDNFQQYVERSPAVLKDAELFALADRVSDALGDLSKMFIDRIVEADEDASDVGVYDSRKAEMLRNGEPGLDTPKKTDGRESK